MKTMVLGLLGLVLVAGIGVGAYLYGQSVGLTQAQNIRTEFFRSRVGAADTSGETAQTQTGQQGQRGLANSARNAGNGTVKSIQGNTIQVTLRDGSAVTVNVDAQTVIQQTVSATVNDIKPGETITFQSDQTGSTVTARMIQLRPTGQGGP